MSLYVTLWTFWATFMFFCLFNTSTVNTTKHSDLFAVDKINHRQILIRKEFSRFRKIRQNFPLRTTTKIQLRLNWTFIFAKTVSTILILTQKPPLKFAWRKSRKSFPLGRKISPAFEWIAKQREFSLPSPVFGCIIAPMWEKCLCGRRIYRFSYSWTTFLVACGNLRR